MPERERTIILATRRCRYSKAAKLQVAQTLATTSKHEHNSGPADGEESPHTPARHSSVLALGATAIAHPSLRGLPAAIHTAGRYLPHALSRHGAPGKHEAVVNWLDVR